MDVKSRIEIWAPLVIAVWTQTILAVGLALSVLHKLPDGAALLLIGVVVSNATAAVQFYFGSSAGSKEKDRTISAQSQQLSDSVPVSALPQTRLTP